MSSTRYCRGCGDEFRITEEQIDKALAILEREPEGCVPDRTYQERMAVCGSCDKLQDGITCIASGSIVRITARMKTWRCPMSLFTE
ncbi:DUF6171 family protein [Paenibacillus nanensis]|uniref:DUF6171 family protein n=1 Tax=Paenibacillus nanensis TaxID=393251 RepID=UPI00269DD45D